MKTKNLHQTAKGLLIVGLALFMAVSFNSCAKKITFQTSSVVPAARGTVKVSKDHNKNFVIKISLYNLAEVSRLSPSKETYVVWMVTSEDVTKNIGKIESSSSFFSKALTGSFETVSSFKPSKIFITAEESADIQYPGQKTILTTERF